MSYFLKAFKSHVSDSIVKFKSRFNFFTIRTCGKIPVDKYYLMILFQCIHLLLSSFLQIVIFLGFFISFKKNETLK